MLYQQERDTVSDSQWQQSYDYQERRDSISDEREEKNFLASVAETFLQMGIPLTEDQKKALEASDSQLNRYLAQI